jgi:glycosyltransferase involved in cell wall biosynthesis
VDQLGGSRIVIVCAHFAEETGYQEVALARAYTRLGAGVRVITSTELSPNARTLVERSFEPGLTVSDEGYEVARLRPWLALGPNVLARGVAACAAEFSPHHVILVGPGKLFGLDVFKVRRTPWRRIAIVQDNSEASPPVQRASARSLARQAGEALLRNPAYRWVVRRADRVVLNVPETRSIVAGRLRPAGRLLLEGKAVDLWLGFDPERFFYDEEAARGWRATNGVADDEVLLGTLTRATPQKRLEEVIDVVSELRAAGVPVRYVLAGLREDEYSRRLSRHPGVRAAPEAFLLLPVLRESEMRTVFSAVDLGFWPRAAITIQQAMGTGLPVVLHRRPTVSHLVQEGVNGWYANPGQLFETLRSAVSETAARSARGRREARLARAALNRSYLSYDVVARRIVDGLE